MNSGRAGLAPYTYFADAGAKMYSANDSWLASLPGAQRTAAAFELMYRLGKDYEKPELGIHQVEVDGTPVPVVERVALEKPFCRLLRFKRFTDNEDKLRDLKDDPTVLVVAPLSGHHATLLRDTVRGLLPTTRCTSPTGSMRAWCRSIRARSTWTITSRTCRSSSATSARQLHVISVCQPTVPVLAACR
jgi:poly(3-hydroxybutyrate) depolymerase